ncbi:hypothetical protein TREPR_1106 [Treponema primitia ZAS-2]|uniref:Uncharacterized protein n=1 Tax=Treponema primitia (strain ATCC BAA-887 / DSM 12427 / ZAS-2) TaxID=545694 RepID=F5YH98_TREPZ|nr:hypothetical protein [Treponema primitia]AEF86287.1 hypothetical protein TREPR_1106 [Treponema primitia ZAS-2]
MATKKNTDPAEFWKEYEAKLGEKVLAFSLGQCISGWADCEPPLWGLLIATGHGFRFHHFPHEGWIQVIARTSSGGAPPTEKTLFVPRDRILSAELRREQSLLKRIVFARAPRFVLRYLDSDGTEIEFLAEADTKAATVAEKLHDIEKTQ